LLVGDGAVREAPVVSGGGGHFAERFVRLVRVVLVERSMVPLGFVGWFFLSDLVAFVTGQQA
jgi:hypothetical protein